MIYCYDFQYKGNVIALYVIINLERLNVQAVWFLSLSLSPL